MSKVRILPFPQVIGLFWVIVERVRLMIALFFYL